MAARKNIIKLAKKISGPTKALFKIDENAPEYYVLDCVVTDKMAEVGLAMELRKPQTIDQISKKCGKSIEETKELAFKLADVGACIFHSENGQDLFELTVFVPGVMEKANANRASAEAHPQIAKAFEEYARLRGGVLSPNMPIGMGPMRVIPIEESIHGDTRVASFEEISYHLDKHTKFAVAPCTCRVSRRILGEGCGVLEDDLCIQLGTGAEYYIRTGKAREITKEEAIEIIKKAEENGLMHSVPNIDGADTIHAICNCDASSCYSMRNALYFNSPDMVRSNYVAEVNKDNCVACGQCVENCPMNALKLGQKLCSTTPIIHKESLSPRNHMWGKKNFNPDYRTTRENVVETGTSPCKTECPAHIAVQGYIKLASQGRYMDALELIKKENPLPAVCGRICPRKCESECTRGDIDEPIAVDEIKKFIADKDRYAETRYVPKKMHDYGKSIAVIGSGPAGLSCAYYLAVDGYKVTVFEKEEKLGGMLTLGIPSFRLEKDVIEGEIEVLRELDVQFKTGVEVGKDVTLDQLRSEGFEAFYVAIGAQKGRIIGIEGEDAKEVITGVEFLRDVNLGKDIKLSGNVIVIGGGNVAIDVARTATRVGAEKVQMYCLESLDEMPALPEEIYEAREEGININNSWGPKGIILEDGKVRGVEFKKCISVFDENKRFSPKYDESKTCVVPADYVLISVGQGINWGNLMNGTLAEFNPNKTIKADSFTYQSDQEDVFVGGDCYTGPKFAIDAIAAGKQGAISIHRFVWEGHSLIYGRDRRKYHSLDKTDAIIEEYDRTPRQNAGQNSGNHNTFYDTRVTFTEEQVKAETQRCLGCGAVILDLNKCVGCGMCATKCKFDAIKLIKKYDEVGTTYEGLPIKLGMNIAARVGRIAGRAITDVVKGRK